MKNVGGIKDPSNLFLEKRLKEAFIYLDISHTQQSSLKTYCDLMKLKDKPTYYHSLRVALYGIKIAEILHLEPKVLFYSGLLHDVGKALIDPKVLVKKKNFDKIDYEKIKKHPLYGYYLLKGIHDFSAEVILRHHRYIGKGYPEELPSSRLSSLSATKVLIDYYSKILSIIDFYDAASTRHDKSGSRIATKREVRKSLNQHFPNQKELINICYKKGIFGKEVKDLLAEPIEKKL